MKSKGAPLVLYTPIDEFADALTVIHGEFCDVRYNVYAIVRDEMFFMPAFLDHYRRLGVEQFVMFDDGSVDGTRAFLCTQPDCVVLSSDLKYGDPVNVRFPDGKTGRKRFGPMLKSIIPRKFFDGKYAIYVDADEFLILPSSTSLPEMFDTLENNKISHITAGMMDFYPEFVTDLNEVVAPSSFEELVALYPYMDSGQLFTIDEGEWPRGLSLSASARMLLQHGIGVKPKPTGWKGLFRRIVGKNARVSAARKTPIARWSKEFWMPNSHDMNVPPYPHAYLALAHFKFTHSFRERIRKALEWGSYSKQGEKFLLYQELIKRVESLDGSLLGPESVRYEDARQLEKLGQIKWPFATRHV